MTNWQIVALLERVGTELKDLQEEIDEAGIERGVDAEDRLQALIVEVDRAVDDHLRRDPPAEIAER